MKHLWIVSLSLSLSLALTAAASVNRSDRNTMIKLGQGDTSEVDLAKIVEPKATNADVKAFAKRMIDEHTKAFDELERIAKAEKVTLKGGMDSEHKKFASELAKKKLGAEYDRTYVEQMVKDHTKDRSAVEKALKTIKNDELKRWAENELKTIEEHLKLVEEVRGKLK